VIAYEDNGGHRALGSTDLRVSEFGLGCARIGGIFQRDPKYFLNLIDAAFDAGINFFDVADIYSQGESERLLGRTFRKRRHRVVLATKAGYLLPTQRRIVARLKPLVRPVLGLVGLSRQQVPARIRGTLTQDFSPSHLGRAVEHSLRRLATDHIDLFQLHSPPAPVVEAGEWHDVLGRLRQQGKIRYYGVSCDGMDAALASLGRPGVSSIQIPLNLLERGSIPAVAAAQAKQVGVIAREVLANGLLAKEPQDVNVASYCRSDHEAATKTALLAEYRRTAAEMRCSLIELALQFVSRMEGVSVTLVGVSRMEQLNALRVTTE
jgi:aryl-alcohol dehydrogenase-like predicted oxidoreductase